MSFPCEEYLELAKKLVQVNDEALLRTAISRAYYAVYHRARQRLEVNGIEILGDQHRGVWSVYQTKSPPGKPPDHCGRIAQAANELRERRIKADYHPVYPGIHSSVEVQLATAERLLKEITELPEQRLPTKRDAGQ